MANAEIIAAGSELLTPEKIDTNSLFLTEELNGLGIEVVKKSIVGDDRERLTASIRQALASADIVILTGGLGPTEDDVTRDAAAAATGRRLLFSPQICSEIEELFRRWDRRMAEINKRQAYVVEGAEILPNRRGTAPGQWIEHNGAVILLLPGPPGEMKPLFANECLPRLQRLVPPLAIRSHFLRVVGLGESDLDSLIAPVYTRYRNPATTILTASGEIHVHLRARCRTVDEAESLLDEVDNQVSALLGDRIYSRDGEDLESTTGALLRERDASLSVAESCTGGLVAERITSVPGSSDYFRGGFLVYTNEMKTSLLGVNPELIAAHTSVSEPVAREMAELARERTRSTHALSVTGYAGPDGDPPGLVFIGLATPRQTAVRRLDLHGDRSRVRIFAAQYAIDMLRRNLLRTRHG